MSKVLIHDDGPDSGLVHATNARFIDSKETICGEKLHPISTLHTPNAAITCEKCLEKVEDRELKKQLDIAVDNINKVIFAARARGLGIGINAITDKSRVKLGIDLRRGEYNIKW